jgi:hypothetical protein
MPASTQPSSAIGEPMSRENTCHVYILARKAADGFIAPVKIGITQSLRSRFRAVQTACPFPIDLYAHLFCPSVRVARDLEASFLGAHQVEHLHGEWLQIEPARAAAVLQLHLLWTMHLVGGFTQADAELMASRCFALGWGRPEQELLIKGLA